MVAVGGEAVQQQAVVDQQRDARAASLVVAADRVAEAVDARVEHLQPAAAVVVHRVDHLLGSPARGGDVQRPQPEVAHRLLVRPEGVAPLPVGVGPHLDASPAVGIAARRLDGQRRPAHVDVADPAHRAELVDERRVEPHHEPVVLLDERPQRDDQRLPRVEPRAPHRLAIGVDARRRVGWQRRSEEVVPRGRVRRAWPLGRLRRRALPAGPRQAGERQEQHQHGQRGDGLHRVLRTAKAPAPA